MAATEVGGLAASPSAWSAATLPQLFMNDLHAPEPGPRRTLTLVDLLADDAAVVRALHARLVRDGATKQAAAHYLVGWFPGLIAAAVGYGLATARAGVTFRATDLTFTTVADGWAEAVTPTRVGAVVAADHPWSGQPDVTTVYRTDSPGSSAVATAAAAALIELVTPFVAACHGLARTRVSSLWNEVADGVGTAVAHQRRIVVDQEMLDALSTALAHPASPWVRTPRLGWATSATLGPVHVAQKGGCCLAFTEPPAAETLEPEVDIETTASCDVFSAHVEDYRRQFPDHPDAKRYCSTCRFRDPHDVDARQLFWAERRPALP